MITHQPTPEQLERLQQAQRAATHTDQAVAEARASLAQALAEHSEATATLTRAIHDVLYGPQDGAPKRLQSAYEASNQMARDHWPTPGGTPGG
jgi:ABC-type transporter Mla subunit MlaD